jgi:serine/threonine protein kinase
MLLLSEQKYCHSDIKPENVTPVQVQGDNSYKAKVIDFGEISRDELVQNTYTPNYLLNPMREYDSNNNIIFKNIEDRLKNEFFTIVRTMQRLLMKENHISQDFAIRKDLMASNRQQYLDKMKDFWSKPDLLANRKSEELKRIISFINTRVFNNESYQLNDL